MFLYAHTWFGVHTADSQSLLLLLLLLRTLLLLQAHVPQR
jgi:hypothetical protein